jgi:hypothetical protein
MMKSLSKLGLEDAHYTIAMYILKPTPTLAMRVYAMPYGLGNRVGHHRRVTSPKHAKRY